MGAPRSTEHGEQRGVYVTLKDLVRLRYKAEGFSFLPRQPVHSVLSGRHASRLRGRGLEFEEIRRYVPGDDTRDIDWKVTARVRKPHVRVYTEEKDRPAIYVTDQRLGMFFGSEKAMKSVTAAEAAAIGAWRSLTMGDRPGAVVFNDSEILEVRPQRSQRSVMQALGAVVDLNRRLGVGRGIQRRPGMLNEALRRVASRVTHDALICIISDLDGADAETRRLATELAEHNDLLVAFIYDPLESRLPAAGRLVVAEDALQLEVDTGSAPVRERFAAAFEERLDLVRHILRQRAVPVLPLSSAEDPAEQLRKLLGHRPGSPRAG